RPDVAFVAGVGAPGVPMSDAELHRRATALSQAGVSVAAVDLATQAWQLLFTASDTGKAPNAQADKLEKLLRKLRADETVKAFTPPEYARASPQLSPMPPL
ncbi:MAG: hypothetical protein ACRD0P_37480, partial [Stackebrandtia sp.]